MPTKRLASDVLFTDGVTRAVYEEPDGRQYVLDGLDKVFGLWVLPDEPEVVDPCLT